MLKKLLVVSLILGFLLVAGTAIATPPGQNKSGAGYYQHSVTNQIKYFKKHPGEPSQWALISPDIPGECRNNECRGKGAFQGTFDQSTSTWKADGDVTIKKNGKVIVNDGAFAASSEEGGGAYYGKYKGDGYGVGGAGSLGLSISHAKDKKKLAIAAALTGNISAAGVGGDLNKMCANIYGNGSHVTIALKSGDLGMALATTSGQFSYNGQTGSGVIVGGGLTGGVSAAYMDKHTAAAFAGGATVSGVGSISMGIAD